MVIPGLAAAVLSICHLRTTFRLTREILVLIVYSQKPLLLAPADVFNEARDLNIGPNLYQHTYYVYTGCDGSGELVQLHRLARDFVA